MLDPNLLSLIFSCMLFIFFFCFLYSCVYIMSEWRYWSQSLLLEYSVTTIKISYAYVPACMFCCFS